MGQAGEVRQGIVRAHIWGLPGKPFPQCLLPCPGHGPGADLALPSGCRGRSSAGEGVAGAAPGVRAAAGDATCAQRGLLPALGMGSTESTTPASSGAQMELEGAASE